MPTLLKISDSSAIKKKKKLGPDVSLKIGINMGPTHSGGMSPVPSTQIRVELPPIELLFFIGNPIYFEAVTMFLGNLCISEYPDTGP